MLVLIVIVVYGIAVFGIFGSDESHAYITERAVKNKRYELCRLDQGGPILSSMSYQASCYASVVEAVADPDLCEIEEIKAVWQDYRGTCYEMVARQSKNLQVCARNKEPEKQDECILNSLSSFPKTQKDITMCELIISDAAKERCILSFARLENNPMICDELKDSNSALSCHQQFEFDSGITREQCQVIIPTGNIYDLEKCMIAAARYNIDRSACDLVKTPEHYLTCNDKVDAQLLHVAHWRGMGACDAIRDVARKAECANKMQSD
jgi:hypothetical protein